MLSVRIGGELSHHHTKVSNIAECVCMSAQCFLSLFICFFNLPQISEHLNHSYECFECNETETLSNVKNIPILSISFRYIFSDVCFIFQFSYLLCLPLMTYTYFLYILVLLFDGCILLFFLFLEK